MSVTEFENQIGAQLQSLEAVVPEPIGRFAATPGEPLKKLVPEKRSILLPTAAVSAAVFGALVIGSLVHRRSAWQGVNAVATGLPRFPKRLKRGFDARTTAGGIVGKYALIGTTYSIAVPRREPEARDVTGGDISAGVPAM